MSNWKSNGWSVGGGSWKCPRCGTIYGSNLKGEKPFLFVSRHWAECKHDNNALHYGGKDVD